MPPRFLLAALLLLLGTTSSKAAELREGDLIFQMSQSAQSATIEEATGSPWTHVGVVLAENENWFVLEAIQPVSITPIADFIARGRSRAFMIRRFKSPTQTGLDPEQVRRLKIALNAHLGKSYDLLFEWDDEKLYCSELVWKAFESALQIRIGSLEPIRNLRLEGPLVRKLIRQRFTDRGIPPNYDEPIVTPASQLQDPQLVTIAQE